MNLLNNTQELQEEINQEVLLNGITNRIRQTLELEEILTATVGEIRAFLQTDRALVYRFHTNGSGQVIAESVQPNSLPSLLGLNFPADDIPNDAREQFLKARQRSTVNVASQKIGISPLDCAETGKPLKNLDIHYRAADACHIQYLLAMGVQFSLVVPILHREKLWGLLVSHHSEPRAIALNELEFVQRVADQVSIAISQSILFSQARQQAQRESTVNKVVTLLHNRQIPPLQAALEETVIALQGCGGRLYITPPNNYSSSQLYTWGLQPKLPATNNHNLIEENPLWQAAINSYLKATHPEVKGGRISDPWIIKDLYNETNLAAFLPAFRNQGIRSLLVMPLQYCQQFIGYLTIFSNEINTEIWWAGRFDSNNQQLAPRQSFQAWRELKKGQLREWTTEEIELIQALGNHFLMAIQHYQLYHQIQAMNANLENEVKDRTEELQQTTSELQQSLELAKVLKQVTNQIRSTLDLPTILQTIVQEVRHLLNADRVIVYHFLHTWEGKVLVEDVIDDKLSILGQVYDPNCFPVEYTYQYQAGRVRAIQNILEAGLSQCHVEFLQSINVQANLVVPIRRSNYLWGLLIAHQCYETRNWQSYELDLLQQLADQAAIAIHQAELYEESCTAATTANQKAEQLELALDALKRTQAQLIQTEKMSSLGQLVAGMAHEINNPINFIYGNLTHVSEYTQNLLELLQLYEEDFPNATARIQQRRNDIELEFLLDDLPRMLSSMKGGADRIRQLVLSLRNFSRLDEAERKAVNIHEGIDSTLLILQNRLKENPNCPPIEVVREYSNLPLVECYAGQLNQVFMNILSNAIDALEQQASKDFLGGIKRASSQITIRTEVKNNSKSSHSPDSVVIRITDNGSGISEAIQAQIFNPFFTTKPVGKGTGLGLSISYQIVVEKHQGSLKCVSQPGQGTEFLIEIPVR